ncbi:SgcJ/EcaC family oxidoreductase [Amycolatopsis cynarae]|uniref:SgcJ/EcaC family oxidoreductase n=1 Tax=Amycolatopsis cynarae TaxID=2995223 RepID=A0ABY7B4V5_9PSEU|nr:SgcJ/EcaC family oxidoreductase [Amycolatopsis sp. HUAS 11-8]WAL66459.1 SgcJ/EcaC family oxidoreductase [Amycolatopsis sp. HUAS 11-8]
MRQAGLTKEDETALRELLQTMEDAWARGDGADYAAAFTDDARYVTQSGMRLIGRRAIAESHQKLFESDFRGTRLGVAPMESQPVAPNVVLLHGSGTVLFPGENAPRIRPIGLLTVVAVNDGDAWRFASFSNTPTVR